MSVASESCLGFECGDLLGSPEPIARDRVIEFSGARHPAVGRYYLHGPWRLREGFAETAGDGASLTFRLRAASCTVTLSSDAPCEVAAEVDGASLALPAGPAETAHRLFAAAPGEHALTFRFPGKGVRCHAFAFEE